MSTELTTKGTPRKRKVKPSLAHQTLDKYGIDKLCEDISKKMSLSAIAQKNKVSLTALMHWIEHSEERAARVRAARQQMARVWDEEAERRLDEAADEFELKKARELAQHYRWRASKTAPKEYGDKLAIGGADDLPPVKTTIDATKLSGDALKELLRARRDPADEE